MASNILTIKMQFEEIESKEAEKFADKTVKQFNKSFEKSARGGEIAVPIITSLKDALTNFDWGQPIKSARKLFDAAMDSITERVAKFGPLGKMVFGAITTAITGMIGQFITMTKVSSDLMRMFAMIQDSGKTMGRSVSDALIDINKISLATGASIHDLTDIYIQLGHARVDAFKTSDGINKEKRSIAILTEAAYLGAKALGANVSQLTEMISSLKVVGRLSDTQIAGPRGIIQAFSLVQDAVGLTEQEMSGLIQTTTDLVKQMGAFGASADTINNIAVSTAKLTGMFGSLGLGANRASDIMSNLFDPSRIGENAYLIREMGFSMAEYMNMLRGGTVDQEKLTTGLVNAAKEIERMKESGIHAVALQQRAQMMGFSTAAEALRVASEGQALLDRINTDEYKENQSYMTKAAAAMGDINGALERLKNRFFSIFGPPMAKIIGALIDLLGKIELFFVNSFGSVDKFGEAVAESIKNFDTEKIGIFFDRTKRGFETFKKYLPVIKGVALALGSLLIVSKVASLFGGLSGILGVAGKGFETVASGATKLTASAGQMLKGGAAIAILTGAFIGFAFALKMIGEVDIESLGKKLLLLGASIVTLSALSIALGALGPVVAAGAVVLGVLSLAMMGFAKSAKTFAEAVTMISADQLKELAAVAKEKDFRQSLKETGLALSALIAPLAEYRKNKMEGIIELFKVLSQPSELTTFFTSLSGIDGTINDKFLGISNGLGTLSESIQNWPARQARQISRFLNDMKPQELQVNARGTAQLAPQIDNIGEIGNINVAIQTSITEQMTRLISKLEELEESRITREEEKLGMISVMVERVTQIKSRIGKIR